MIATFDRQGEAPVVVPVSGTALLLIDVINDLAFEGSEALVAQAQSMAAPLAGLKRRATAAGVPTIYINDNFGHGGLMPDAPSRIAPRSSPGRSNGPPDPARSRERWTRNPSRAA